MVDLKDIEEKLVITNSILESINKKFSFNDGIGEILEGISNSLNDILTSLETIAKRHVE